MFIHVQTTGFLDKQTHTQPLTRTRVGKESSSNDNARQSQ